MSENTTNLIEEKIEETNEEINKQNVKKNENIPPFNAQTNATDPSFMVDGKEFIYNHKGKMVKKPFYSFSNAFFTILFTPLVPFFLYKKYWQGIIAYVIYLTILAIFLFNLHINASYEKIWLLLSFFFSIILGFVYPKILPIKKVKESIFNGIIAAFLALLIPMIPTLILPYIK